MRKKITLNLILNYSFFENLSSNFITFGPIKGLQTKKTIVVTAKITSYSLGSKET
jgi:hypothetical protein